MLYQKKSAGFTLIELIVVIVILGILASTAMPKFVNLRREARIATLHGMEGALRSLVVMTQGAYAMTNNDSSGQAIDKNQAYIFNFPLQIGGTSVPVELTANTSGVGGGMPTILAQNPKGRSDPLNLIQLLVGGDACTVLDTRDYLYKCNNGFSVDVERDATIAGEIAPFPEGEVMFYASGVEFGQKCRTIYRLDRSGLQITVQPADC